MILTFESGDEILNHIISYVSMEKKKFQSFVSAKKNLIFGGENIFNKLIVKKQLKEIILIFIESEILLLLAQNAGIVFNKKII